MVKKVQAKKGQTGTLSSEEINKALGGDIAGATKKVYDHYAGKTQVKREDGRRNVPIIEDKRIDPYPNKKNLKTDKRGEELNITLSSDDKAVKRFRDD